MTKDQLQKIEEAAREWAEGECLAGEKPETTGIRPNAAAFAATSAKYS